MKGSQPPTFGYKMPNFPDNDPNFTFPSGASDVKDNSACPFTSGNDNVSGQWLTVAVLYLDKWFYSCNPHLWILTNWATLR